MAGSGHFSMRIEPELLQELHEAARLAGVSLSTFLQEAGKRTARGSGTGISPAPEVSRPSPRDVPQKAELVETSPGPVGLKNILMVVKGQKVWVDEEESARIMAESAAEEEDDIWGRLNL